MAKQYYAKAPQQGYQGVCYGVRFFDGVALIAEHTISPYLGRTVEEIADGMRNDFGYEVTAIAESALSATPKAKPKVKRKTTKKDVKK
jgi:hypothetical protein